MLTRGRLLFICFSLTVVFVVAGATMAASTADGDDGVDSPYKYLAVFMEVFGLVDKAYVDPPDHDQLMSGAFEGAVDALDPFSLYIPAGQVKRYQATREVGSRRSGLLMLKERGVAYAVAVEEGSPAAEAGLQSGDILSEINGLRTRRTPLFELRAILAAAPGTEVKIERLRQGRKKELTLTLAEYARPAVSVETHRGVAVLRIPCFYDSTLPGLEGALETVHAAFASLGDLASSAPTAAGDASGEPSGGGAPVLAGLEQAHKLVIDLRGVAGGEPSVAYRAAGMFADDGELGALLKREQTLESFGGGVASFEGSVVLLVNRGTQGAAEVFATVLHTTLDAKLVGESTFGHAGRHTLVELSDGARLQLTDAFFTGPDREPIDDSLKPDVWVRLYGDEDETEDRILEAGVDVVLGGDDEVEEQAAA